MKKKIILIILILLLTGCSDYRELTDMAIVPSFAIDYKDNKYHVIVHVLDAKKEDKKAEYETLLKLNDNDYRRTVLQIEYEKGLANVTNKTE